jgi:hypothetical protein
MGAAAKQNTYRSREKSMSTETEVLSLRTRVAELEAQVQFLYQHLGVTYVPEAMSGYDTEIAEYLKRGDMLGAIKIHRARHNSSLAEAKAEVEALKARLGY